ncbi:MAG: hypothetical protein JWM11_3646 [Planctomycetaceae bacterium]|nr:hypothetical protein [Planctomycetaceae bacterium]
MRKSRTLWQRCFLGNWSRKFVVVSLAIATTAISVTSSVGFAPGGKKPLKNRAVDKVARKTDETEAKVKELPKEVAENHPLKPLIKLAEESLAALKPIKDYSATLYKTELLHGKVIESTLLMKLRQEPFSVYLKFETLHAGREVIFVEGQNKGKLIAHEAGIKSLAGTLSYLPTDKNVLLENRYPITQVGMTRLLESLIAQWKAEGQFQEVKVETYSGAQVGDRECRLLEVIHPQPREHFKFHKTKLFLETKTKFPIRFEQYGWPEKEGDEPVLLEEYIYTKINTNLGLTDLDFDKNNKAYEF